jgi:hypothetical protein
MRIIANSLPKSGTHLLTRLLHLLKLKEANLHLSGSLVRPKSKYRFINYMKRKQIILNENKQGLAVDLDYPNVKVDSKWLLNRLDKLPKHSFCQGHLPYTLELEEAFEKINYKVLHIYRDPRDVLISFCNHQLRYNNYPMHTLYKNLSKYDQVKMTIRGNNDYYYAGIKDRINNSIGWIHSKKIFSVKFEDLIGVKGGGNINKQIKAISEICNYLNFQLTESKTEHLCNSIFYEKSETFFKGRIGAWKKEDKLVIRMIETELANLINILGYDK